MFKYTFPKPATEGMFYNLSQKIQLLVGQEFTMSQRDETVMLTFANELSPAEQQDLSDLFNSAEPYECTFPGFIDTGSNCFYIKDIYEWMTEFKTNTGLDFLMWFEPSGDPTKRNDLIKLQFSQVLTQQQKKAIEDEYKTLFSWGKP